MTWVGPKGQKKTVRSRYFLACMLLHGCLAHGQLCSAALQATCVAGQSLRDIARGSGIPIVYDCQEGTCKTCEAKVGNGRAKIWCAAQANCSHQANCTHTFYAAAHPGLPFCPWRSVTKMPNKDVTIQWGLRQS